MNQTVKIFICNDDSEHTYSFNVYNQHEHQIHIDINDEGTIDLAVRFNKNRSGLFYCSIYQIYSYNKRGLIYNQPIVDTLEPEDCDLSGYIIANEGFYNSDVEITDDEGNITGTQQIVSLGEFLYGMTVYFTNKNKQKEANQLYERYKRNKVEIDTIRELAEAYDRLQARK